MLSFFIRIMLKKSTTVAQNILSNEKNIIHPRITPGNYEPNSTFCCDIIGKIRSHKAHQLDNNIRKPTNT